MTLTKIIVLAALVVSALAFNTVKLANEPKGLQTINDGGLSAAANFVAVGTYGANYLVGPKGIVATLPSCATSQCTANHCLTLTADPDNKLAYFSGGGGLHAINFQGTTVWTLTNLSCSYGPTFYDDNLYVTGADGSLNRLDSKTGALGWTLTGNFLGKPVVSKNTVLVKDSSKGLCGFSLSGAPLWCNNNIFPMLIGSSLSVIENTFISKSVFVQDTKYTIYKVSLLNGKEEWTLNNIQKPHVSNYADNSVYMTAGDFTLYAYNGTAVITVDASFGTASVLVKASANTFGGGLCLTNGGGTLYSLNDAYSFQTIDTTTGDTTTINAPSPGDVMGCASQQGTVYITQSTNQVIVFSSSSNSNEVRDKARYLRAKSMLGKN